MDSPPAALAGCAAVSVVVGTHPYVGHVLGGDLLARLVVVHAVLAVAELDILLHQLHRLHLNLELAGLQSGGWRGGDGLMVGQTKPESYGTRVARGCNEKAKCTPASPYARARPFARLVVARQPVRPPSRLGRPLVAAPSLGPPATWLHAATRTRRPRPTPSDDDAAARSPTTAPSDAPSAPATGET